MGIVHGRHLTSTVSCPSTLASATPWALHHDHGRHCSPTGTRPGPCPGCRPRSRSEGNSITSTAFRPPLHIPGGTITQSGSDIVTLGSPQTHCQSRAVRYSITSRERILGLEKGILERFGLPRIEVRDTSIHSRACSNGPGLHQAPLHLGFGISLRTLPKVKVRNPAFSSKRCEPPYRQSISQSTNPPNSTPERNPTTKSEAGAFC